MYHKAYDEESWEADWDSLGGDFTSGLAVVSWGSKRLDNFAIGTDSALYHNSWAGNEWQSEWDSLSGLFISAPAVTSWSSDRLDLFGIGGDSAVYHQSWNGSSWQSEWDSLGGIFTSPPVAISREPNRLDVFGTETDDAIWHKGWDGSSWQEDWDSLGNAGQKETSKTAQTSSHGVSDPSLPKTTEAQVGRTIVHIATTKTAIGNQGDMPTQTPSNTLLGTQTSRASSGQATAKSSDGKAISSGPKQFLAFITMCLARVILL